MRLQALALSLLASTTLATPFRRDTKQAIYTLRLSSPVPSLNGLYLTTSPTSTALTASSGTDNTSGATVRFYPVRNSTTGLSELRAADSSGAALAVVGANGLLDFSSLADPAAVTVPVGTTVDWTSFSLEGGDVKYAGAGGEGRWVAFPTAGAGGVVKRGSEEGWSVKWKDANAWTTENYMPVQVVYELVQN